MKLKEKVCVLFGGNSDERAISIRSGTAILESLRKSGVNAYGLDASNGYQSHLKQSRPDLAFIAVHGHGGEDGVLQRSLEKLAIKYVGSNPKPSLLAFDKISAKRRFRSSGVPTPEWMVATQSNLISLSKKIRLPVVIKPSCNGSSIGIRIVNNRKNLRQSLQSAIRKYRRVLIEQKICGREFTVGILGERALPVIELKPKRKFYDYKAKYTKGLTEYLVPAPISRSLARRIQSIALKAHQSLKLRDFSRVDVMVDSDQNLFVLEVNSIPGFTETSLLPKAARAAGISFDELCLRLLSFARKRKRDS